MVNILQFYFALSYTGPKILLYTFLSKIFNCFLSLFVSVQDSDAYVNIKWRVLNTNIQTLTIPFHHIKTGQWKINKLFLKELNTLWKHITVNYFISVSFTKHWNFVPVKCIQSKYFTYTKYVNQIKSCMVTLWSYKQLVDWYNTTVKMHNKVEVFELNTGGGKTSLVTINTVCEHKHISKTTKFMSQWNIWIHHYLFLMLDCSTPPNSTNSNTPRNKWWMISSKTE